MADTHTPTEQQRKLLSREQNYETRDWCRSLDRPEHQVRKTFFATTMDAAPPAPAALELRG